MEEAGAGKEALLRKGAAHGPSRPVCSFRVDARHSGEAGSLTEPPLRAHYLATTQVAY